LTRPWPWHVCLLTDVEDAPQASRLRCAPNVLLNSIVVNARWVMSFALDKPAIGH
jgi:hypothetical protein